LNPQREEIESLVRELAPGYGLDAEVVLRQIEAESSFRQDAVSSCGARGLMQITAICAEDLKKRFGIEVNPADWRQNISGGMAFLAYLKRKYGDYSKALAAYNWGEGHLDKLLRDHPKDWEGRLPQETANYLLKILDGKPQSV
jgi:soluble lytic murein transglycosylase-like protein